MKKVGLIVFSILLLIACNKGKPASAKRIVSNSSGNINNLTVVVDNDLWEGSVGKIIRDSIGAYVYGLPQDEPSFTMKQMPPSVFTDFARKNRIVLKVEKGVTQNTKFYEDTYARPQKMVVVSGQTNKEIIDQLVNNQVKIISVFKNEEIKERQRRTNISLHKNNTIEEKLGLSINFPSAYRIAKEEGNFFWIRRDVKTGTLNLVLYEMPLETISKGETAIDDVIKMRDSISKQHIPGPTEDTFMITDDAYWPFIGETILDNKPTIETKSTWIVKGAFMSGPFINYVIEDKVNNRVLVAEGFVFAPSVDKRDYVFELESIIKSIEIK